MQHVTVLKLEAIDALNLSEGSVVVDCTLGSGGHARAILARLSASGTYVGIDADPTATAALLDEVRSYEATVHLVTDNFKNIKTIVNDLSLPSVDAIIADLGWRMEQFSGATDLARGFSFNQDEPLAMTFGDPAQYPFTAADIVNDWAEEDIANVIYAYGQDRYARRIAQAIVAARQDAPIATAKELGAVIYQAVPKMARYRKTHPATKTFQALRVAVNDELDTLRTLLLDGFAVLSPGGRMSIISFHSLEDRVVKETFKSFVHDQRAVLANKKPLVPTRTEITENPRARSAKLRTIEKL